MRILMKTGRAGVMKKRKKIITSFFSFFIRTYKILRVILLFLCSFEGNNLIFNKLGFLPLILVTFREITRVNTTI